MAKQRPIYNRYFRSGSEITLDQSLGDAVLPLFSLSSNKNLSSKFTFTPGIGLKQSIGTNLSSIANEIGFIRNGIHQIGVMGENYRRKSYVSHAKIMLDNGYGQPLLTGYSRSDIEGIEVHPDFFLLDLWIETSDGKNPSFVSVTGDRNHPRNLEYLDMPGIVLASDFLVSNTDTINTLNKPRPSLVSALLLMCSNMTFRVDVTGNDHCIDHFIETQETADGATHEINTWINNPLPSSDTIQSSEKIDSIDELNANICYADNGMYFHYTSSTGQFFMADWQLRKRLSLGHNITPFRSLSMQ